MCPVWSWVLWHWVLLPWRWGSLRGVHSVWTARPQTPTSWMRIVLQLPVKHHTWHERATMGVKVITVIPCSYRQCPTSKIVKRTNEHLRTDAQTATSITEWKVSSELTLFHDCTEEFEALKLHSWCWHWIIKNQNLDAAQLLALWQVYLLCLNSAFLHVYRNKNNQVSHVPCQD